MSDRLALLKGLSHEVKSFNWSYSYSESLLVNGCIDTLECSLRMRLCPIQVFKILSTHVFVTPPDNTCLCYDALLDRLIMYFEKYKFILMFELFHIISVFSDQPSDVLEEQLERMAIIVYKNDMLMELPEHLVRLAYLTAEHWK